MKFLHHLLNWLGLALVMAAILVAAAFIPAVQTWAAQYLLSGRAEPEATIESFSASFGKAEAAGLHLKFSQGVLDLPSVTAELPILAAIRGRQLPVRRLVAKGWTLDLRSNPTASAQDAIRLMGGLMARMTLPCPVSLESVDLEGDILLAGADARAPMKVHVAATGGGIGPGREGALAVTVSSIALAQDFSPIAIAGHGRLTLAMNSPRTFSRLGLVADLSAKGGPFPDGLDLSARLATAARPDGEAWSIDVSRGSVHLVALEARWPEGSDRIDGTWKVDLKESDVLPFAPGRPLPGFKLAGAGSFDTDSTLYRVHALGRGAAALGRPGAWHPSLERLGAVTVAGDFDASLEGRSLRVDRLSLSLAGAGPVAKAVALQPLVVDTGTGAIRPSQPDHDWMDINLLGLPVSWLPGPAEGVSLAGADLTGRIILGEADGHIAARSKAPLAAARISVLNAGREVVGDLAVAGSLSAVHGPRGWRIEGAPLRIARGGLAAAGKFTAEIGTATEFTWDLAASGSDPRLAATANLRASVDASGRIWLQAPVRIGAGPAAAEFTVEGTWIHDEELPRVDLKVAGASLSTESLALWAAARAAPVGRDASAFWGRWTGRVALSFDRVKAGSVALNAVSGTLRVGPESVRLEEGRAALVSGRTVDVTGVLAFDRAAAEPYRLKATTRIDRVDAAPFFPGSGPGDPPAIEGRFSVEGTLLGNGTNLADLAARAREEFRLESTDGIVRFLRTDVHEAIPHEDRPVADALDSVGSAFGAVFGTKKKERAYGNRLITPAAEAVIDFTNEVSEVGLDRISAVAVRGADGSIRLTEIDLTERRMRITGTGLVAAADSLPLGSRALSLDLRFAAKGRIARLLATAGLLEPGTDRDGFALLNQPIHLGGTMSRIDPGQWHQILVKAAERRPAVPAKKGG